MSCLPTCLGINFTMKSNFTTFRLRLCTHIGEGVFSYCYSYDGITVYDANLSGEAVTPLYQKALRVVVVILSSQVLHTLVYTLISIAENITVGLARNGSV